MGHVTFSLSVFNCDASVSKEQYCNWKIYYFENFNHILNPLHLMTIFTGGLHLL
jgi:hypothetical protein